MWPSDPHPVGPVVAPLPAITPASTVERLWDDWLLASAACADAFIRWSAAQLPSARRDAYDAYRAALIREELAAGALAAGTAPATAGVWP